MQKLLLKEKLSNLRKANESFVFFIAFLYSISTSNQNATEMMKTAENSGYGRYSSIFKDVSHLGIGWGYGLSKSCDIIAARIPSKDHTFRNLLVKLSQVIKLGGQLREFLKDELDYVLHNYIITYERSLDSQRLFLEMYYTIMSTVSMMIAANSMLTMLTGAEDTEMTLKISITAVMVCMATFVFVLHMLFPRDDLMVPNKDTTKKFRLSLYLALPMSLMIGATLFVSHVLPPTLIIPIASVPLLVPSFFALKLESTIKKLDGWYPQFIMQFGQLYSTTGSLGNTLDSILRTDFNVLGKHIISFSNRIKNKVDREKAFDLFSKDTGSFLISAGNRIVAKSISNGSELGEVGNKVANVASRVNEMRAKRRQISKTFEMVIIILHVMTLAVFALINKIADIFHNLLSDPAHTVGFIKLTPVNPEFLYVMLPAIVLVMSIINAFAIKIAQGGIYKTVILYIVILNIVGGLTTYGVGEVLGKFLGNSILDVDL